MRRGGGGGGEDGNACNQSQIFYRTPFAHERGAIVQFDWLVARQSKSDIKNLTFMHNRHPEYHTTNKIKNMAESVEAFEFLCGHISLLILCKISKLRFERAMTNAAIIRSHIISPAFKGKRNCFSRTIYFSWALSWRLSKMVYRKLMIIGSNVTVGVPRECGLFGGVR